MAIYAVGDIQGCFLSLMNLLEVIQFRTDQDELWLAGDVVNRGAHSLEVLRFLYPLRDRIIWTLGNHDLHLLAVAEGIAPMNRADTISSILTAPDRGLLLEWMRHQKLFYQDDNHHLNLVHAGIPPQWDIAKTKLLAQEVEQILQSKDYQIYLTHLYGNEPQQWEDNLSGFDRLRFITNALTRLRFCTSEGKLDLKAKGTLLNPPKNFLPWFDVADRKSRNERILFGHWAALKEDWHELTLRSDIFPLDGGCVWGGSLCALRIDDMARFEVPCA